jgi:hypothetical protein
MKERYQLRGGKRKASTNHISTIKIINVGVIELILNNEV